MATRFSAERVLRFGNIPAAVIDRAPPLAKTSSFAQIRCRIGGLASFKTRLRYPISPRKEQRTPDSRISLGPLPTTNPSLTGWSVVGVELARLKSDASLPKGLTNLVL